MPDPSSPDAAPGDPVGSHAAGGAPAAGDPAAGSSNVTGPTAAAEPPRKRRFRLPPVRREVRWTLTLVVLIFVFEYVLLPEIASARKSVNLLGKVSIGLLVLALVLEVVALLSYAELSHTVLSPGAPSRWRLFRVNMSTLAVSHVLPGGTAAGGALGYRLLTELDVPGGTAAFGLATQGVGSAVVLNVIFWLALLISIPIDGVNPLYGFAALAGVLLLAAFAGTVLLLTRGERQAADALHRMARHVPFVDPDRVSALVQHVADRLKILLQRRDLLRHALVWAASNWLFDAASLWVFLFAYGAGVSPIHLLVAYGLANVLAAIPITPGGLGVVEGVLIPTLVGFGVPRAEAILGVLTYRLVNFWLPIPMGGLSYLSLRVGRSRRQAESPEATA